MKEYLDGSGNPTIGYGHKLPKLGTYPDGIDEDQALAIFNQDVHEMEAGVKRKVKVKLTQYQYDALVSLVFNMGETEFGKTLLLQFLNNGNYIDAAGQFLSLNQATDRRTGIKRPNEGLTNRRRLEREIFLHGKYK